MIGRLESAVDQAPEKYANIRGFLVRVPESKFYRPPPKRPGMAPDPVPTDREIQAEFFYL